MKIQYAVVDIETTGGNASGSRITEIAIRIYNGIEIIEAFDSLVNPQKDIPLAIFGLTGIDNYMVKDAPLFADIAEHVFALLNGRVFVAHNVNFDYSFLKHQLEECGYKWTARKLCTVRMARKIRPGLPSYSLGRLCDALHIPIQARHRAGGDCDATAVLFSELLRWDQTGVIVEMLKKTSKDQCLPPNLPKEQFDQLPEKPGVYYFHDRNPKVIYVGKALNIKKRVGQHFSGHTITPQRQHFLREIYSISVEVCATELMALLLECSEIKRLWPAYNRALKRFEPKFGLHRYRGIDGYDYLAIGRVAKESLPVQLFNREYDGAKMLVKMAQEHDIDLRFCKFHSTVHVPRVDDPTEIPNEGRDEASLHNDKVEQAIQTLIKQQPTFAIWDNGRTAEEKSCIWVQDGMFYGMGYLDVHNQSCSFEDIQHSLQRYRGNYYMMQLIYTFAEKYPWKVHRYPQENRRKDLPLSNNQSNPYYLRHTNLPSLF